MSLWKRLIEWMFPPVRSYRITRDARKIMQSMARQTHPKEAFGVLRGEHKNGVLVVHEVAYQPFKNTTNSAHVLIDPFAVTDLVGTFHSHPTPNNQPSKADLHLFSKHPGVHCIAGYPYNTIAVYNQQGELLDVITL